MKTRLKKNELKTRKDDTSFETADEISTTGNELDEMPDFSTMLSTQRERKISRRSGIAERNQTERMIVRKTVENLVLIKTIKDITHV